MNGSREDKQILLINVTAVILGQFPQTHIFFVPNA